MEINKKITNSIDQMISDAMLEIQYYGEFCQFINFKKSIRIKTCGVTVDIQGMRFYYNDEFVNGLDQEEMNFIMLHEIFHLLWDHQTRERRCGYDHDLSNMVQDMIINQVINTDIILRMEESNKREHRNLSFAKIPVNKESNKIWVLTMPKEYKGKLIYEDMYEWIFEEKKKYDEWKNNCKCDKDKKCICNRADGKESCECGNCPVSDYLRKLFDQLELGILDFLDSHLPSDMPEDFRKSIIENIKNNLRNSGFETADILSTIGKLTKSKKDYIKSIKICINELFGIHKEKSITKKNRRSINGVKGKKKGAFALSVILDVSGSMESYFEKALSYIFQNDIIVQLLQIDTEVKSHTTVKNKREMQKIKICGLGGTTISPAIQYVVNNKKLKKLNLLILTDGETDILDFRGFNNKCMILSTHKKCETINISGCKIKQIVIKD